MSMQAVLKIIHSNLTDLEKQEGFKINLAFNDNDRSVITTAAKVKVWGGELVLLLQMLGQAREPRYVAVNIEQIQSLSCDALERSWSAGSNATHTA